MNVATLVALLVVAAVALGLALRRGELRDPAAVLRLLAVLCAVLAAGALFRAVWIDSGSFALWGLGLPVLVTLAPLFVARARFGAAVTAVAAGLLLAWSLLLALGIGLFFLPAALVETAAAVAQRRPRAVERGRTGATSGG